MHVKVMGCSLFFLPSVWLGFAPGNREHRATNECNTRRFKLHGNHRETKRELYDLSEHTPAAKGNAGLVHANAVTETPAAVTCTITALFKCSKGLLPHLPLKL